MSKPVDFDPSEWREVLPGIYSLKSDPQKLCFECIRPDPKPKKEGAKKVAEVAEEEAKIEEGQE